MNGEIHVDNESSETETLKSKGNNRSHKYCNRNNAFDGLLGRLSRENISKLEYDKRNFPKLNVKKKKKYEKTEQDIQDLCNNFQ